MSDDTDLLSRIEAFLAATEMRPTTFGKKAIGDQNLVPSLRSGNRDLRLSTRNRILRYIEDYKNRVNAATAA